MGWAASARAASDGLAVPLAVSSHYLAIVGAFESQFCHYIRQFFALGIHNTTGLLVVAQYLQFPDLRGEELDFVDHVLRVRKRGKLYYMQA